MILVECGKAVLCNMCFARSPPCLRHGQMVKWLKTCPGGSSSQASKEAAFWIGGPDPTHCILSAPAGSEQEEGFVWCSKCGSWDSRRYRALRQPCLGKPTGAAQTALLRCIANGKGPPGFLGPDSVAVKAKSQQQLQELCIIGLDSESGEDE